MLAYDEKLKANARKLRSNMTDTEQLIWQKLRRKQMLGVQFYRQKPIGSYIVDFYAPQVKLVVEIDGGQHFDQKNKRNDQVRDIFLQGQGLHILRFDNFIVSKQLNDVLSEIYRVLEQKMQGG
ncbi:MAG: DUF559 domain-containing protein [Mariprofundaceae bacterium]